jgi:hypothetical protein
MTSRLLARQAMCVLAAMGCAWVAVPVRAESPSPVRITTDDAEYVLGADGQSLHFIDRRTGADYCVQKPRTPFARVRKNGQEHPATAVSYAGGVLSVQFGRSGASAAIQVTAKKRYCVLEVKELRGDGVEELVFVDLRLTTQGLAEEPFAACALALNLQTKVPELPQAARRLRASCYPRFGFAGAKVALIGCPQADLRKVMQAVVSEAPDLPRSRIGGPWALDAPENYGSYLMTGGVTEDKVDDWIHLALSLGMRQIDIHGGHCFRFGDCEPNPKMYPRGRASFKAVIDKLHAAGILAGLHTYAFFIAKNCPWVTPVPDPRLGKDATLTLSAALPPSATIVPVEESTRGMSSVTGFFVRNSATLQIDDELITYSEASQKPPYAFQRCKRGACGTRVAPHAKGAKVHHLRECFGMFVPDGDSTLFTEVAAKTAQIYNECGFDMIYLDALDGEDVIAGRENGWHYGSKFTFEICKRLRKPAIMEMSTFHHHLWYVRSRMGAWDHPSRSHKKFIDFHCAGNESCRRVFLPANLGWWSFNTWTGALTEPTFPDDIEYLCSKALAHDSSIEISVAPESMTKTPALPRLAAIVKQYEELRRAKCVSEEVKEQLRVPGDEFSLTHSDSGQWQFRRIQYDKHKVEGWDGRSNRWTVTNKFARQPPAIRIQALLSAAAYDAPGNVTLADFADTKEFSERATHAGITARLESSGDQVKAGTASGRYTAGSTMSTRQGAWSKVGKTFSPAVNLGGHQAMGVWVHGDGQGEVLNLQLKSPPGFIPGDGDHYIVVDFHGWRYFELIEPEGQRYSDYSWPYGGLYSIYRENVTYSHVHALNVFCNHIPAKGSATCYLSPIRAIPTARTKLRNPAITMGGKRIVFPVEIESGSYLEFRSAADCRLYGSGGEMIAGVKVEGEVPVLESGENQVTLLCDPPAGPTPRACVWLISQGEVVQRGRRTGGH